MKDTKILIMIGVGIGILFIINGIYLFRDKQKQPNIWYVEQGLEEHWARVLRDTKPAESSNEIRVWDGDSIPTGRGILITTNIRQIRKQAAVYYRLSYDLHYEGAMVLALDPWMVFHKNSDPELTADRVYGGGGAGVVLIPGKDPEAVRAWTARLKKDQLFETGLFPEGAQTYNWQDVFYRLMSGETAWVYAPLSAIRRYPNFRKSILSAAPFPERDSNTRSLQAALLWAVPFGSPEEQKKMGKAIAWLKKPQTQTIIADNLDWIPADPYGRPFNPVSLTAHRSWLTTEYIYEADD
jgi:hypothetical protein